jgi:hypothetical protein
LQVAIVLNGVDGRMGFVVLLAHLWALESAVLESCGERTPLRVRRLPCNQLQVVECRVKLVCLCARVRAETLVVQRLGRVEDLLRWEAEQARPVLLQLDRRERVWFPGWATKA